MNGHIYGWEVNPDFIKCWREFLKGAAERKLARIKKQEDKKKNG